MTQSRALSVVAAAGVLLAACAQTTQPAAPPSSALSGSITIFAASSLTAAFSAIGADFQKAYPTAMLHFSFAGSSTLVAQVQQGAIGDVFASADEPNMQKLVNAGLTAGSPAIFARNKLQIVVPAGNAKHVTGLADLGRMGLVVVLCAPAVPCGHYAAEALQRANVTVTPASQETDVKAVLSKVALGEADAGIVYETDVKAAGGQVQGVDIPEAFNVIADYPIVVLKDSQNVALARAFIGYIHAAGQRTLARYGFLPA
jgi:molybdate transport system substrate-binding protein